MTRPRACAVTELALAFRRPLIHSTATPLILRADDYFCSVRLLSAFSTASVSAVIASHPPVVWEPPSGSVRLVLLTFASRSAAVDALLL